MTLTEDVTSSTERTILGCLILDGLTAMESCRRLREDMFSLESHRRLYRALTELIADGIEPTVEQISEKLGREGVTSVGGWAYISELTSGIPRRLGASGHVDLAIEKWKLRKGRSICEHYSAMFQDEDPADDILSRMQSEVFDVLQEKAAQEDPRIAALTVPALDEVLDYSKPAMGLSYGHGALNEFTSGMQAGQVTVVGARSGVGKTALMIQAAYCNAKQGIASSLFSLEMGKKDVLMRLWAMDSGLPFYRIQRKMLNVSEQRVLRESAYRVADSLIRIYDDGDMTLAQIAATARLDARRNGMQFFGVDYAQIVNATAGKTDTDRVKETSRTLTKLAKSEKVHLMLLSQLRKMPVEQYNRPPHMSDLADTRQLENDGHVVLLLHRGYDEQAGKIAFDAEIMVPKQRSGGTGVLPSQFNKNTLRYD